MPRLFEFTIPGEGLKVPLEAGVTTIFVGANGSGKTRLAAKLEELAGTKAHRIAAQRALSLNPDVRPISEKLSRQILQYGYENDLDPFEEPGRGPAKTRYRWHSNPATHFLSDFDPLLQWLFAEQKNIAVTAYNALINGVEVECKATAFHRLKYIWEKVLPNKRLIISGDTVKVGSSDEEELTLYSAAELSDGERAIFYMIGQVIAADDDCILIFDEPELHVHRSILGRLWDELEGLRPDCAFVLITHDLEFAASRPARIFVLERFLPPESWVAQALPEGTGFSEQLTATILGSRRPILFVEGEGDSLDLAIYRACFPAMTVVPRGSCERVIQSVKIMRANSELTRVTCAGIVDADSRTTEDIDHLATMGIYVLPVSEIENLLALPTVASVILDYDHHNEADKQVRLDRLKAALFADAAKPTRQTAIVLDHCRRRIDRALKVLDFTESADEATLKTELERRVGSIDVTSIASEVRTAIANAIEADDLRKLLKIYDRKALVLNSLAAMKDFKKDAFTSWVVRAIKAPDRPELREAIRRELPFPIAQ